MGFKAGLDRDVLDCSDYVFIGAGVTTKQVSVGTNSVGDYLDRVVVSPLSSAAGAVSIFDGTTAVISVAAVPTASGASMSPFTIDVGAVAVSTKGWNVTCGSNVQALAVGRFPNGGIKV